MSAIIPCPHCGKDIPLTVVNPIVTNLPYKPKVNVKVNLVNTEQARQMRNGINIEGVMGDKSDVRTVNKKAGGNIDICDIWLKDDKGEIKVNLWGDDTKLIHNGTKIRFTNAYTNSFNGEVSLQKGKYGKMEILS